MTSIGTIELNNDGSNILSIANDNDNVSLFNSPVTSVIDEKIIKLIEEKKTECIKNMCNTLWQYFKSKNLTKKVLAIEDGKSIFGEFI
jgi:hypothetical protein